ncbi:hypothetical protein [Dyadobacter sp. 32]|uniref:hypothetical protein n=1 Tax=Dyadobacter sp. 32 TaxID=538966 RepID=UPI0011EEF23A
MQVVDIVQEIQRLPLDTKIYVMEETLKSIRSEAAERQIKLAADMLYEHYANDQELTAFTSLDLERFYETK